MSFYGDTAYAIFLWVVTKFFSQGLDEASLKPVTSAILGVFGHGCGHLWVAMNVEGKHREGIIANRDEPFDYHVKTFTVFAFFWYTLTMAHIPVIGRTLHAAFVTLFLFGHYYLVPLQCAFGYVQTCLIIMMATCAMLEKSKD